MGISNREDCPCQPTSRQYGVASSSGVLVLGLHAGAVPPMSSKLVLALVHGHLDALYGRRHDVSVAVTEAHLARCETRVRPAHRITI